MIITIKRVSKHECAFVTQAGKERRVPFEYNAIHEQAGKLRKAGHHIKIEPRLKDWLKKQAPQPVSVEPNQESDPKPKTVAPFEMIASETELGKALAHRHFQAEGVDFIKNHRNVLVADEPGLGKALTNETRVLTPSGYVKMGKISIDDKVIGSDGLPHNVTGVFPQGLKEVATVILSDGSVVDCSMDHLWTVQEVDYTRTWRTKTLTTKQIWESGLFKADGRRKFRLPMIKPVEFSGKDAPFDPYTVGVLLGDGSLSCRNWSITTDHEIIENLCVTTTLAKDSGIYGSYRIPARDRDALENLGLKRVRSESKRIPKAFMLTSSVDRIALLQGLLDTDGTPVSGRGKPTTTIEYGTVSRRLAEQVKFIVESLGGTASIALKAPRFTYNGEGREGQLFYRMTLALPSGVIPFRLTRKLEGWVPRTRLEPQRYINEIKVSSRMAEMTCISIDSDDKLYAVEGCVLTHNTLQAMSGVIESGCTGSILIVAPKSAAYVTWPHELERWLSEVAPYDEWVVFGGKMTKLQRIRALKRILLWDMGKGRTGPRQWVIVSPNYLRFKVKLDSNGNYVYDADKNKIIQPVREAEPALLSINWSGVIVDEAHQTLAGATGNKKHQSAQRQGLGLIEVADSGLRIALSGTPFRGKHENLWGILNWLDEKRTPPYWTWISDHFNVYIDTRTNARVVGSVRDEKKFAKSLADIMIRRTKQEVAPELPQKLYGGTPLVLPDGKHGPIAVWLDMQGQQKKAYEQMVHSAMAELEGGTLMANGVLAEMIRLKQFANSYGFIGGTDEFFPCFPSNKFDWLIDFLADRGIDGKGPGASKVIVASQFTKHIDMFASRLETKLKIPTFVLTGKTSEQNRIKMQAAFQDPNKQSPDVFLLNTKAGGVSLTLDAADDVVIIDSTFNAEDQEQVEDRAHRLSRIDHSVQIWNLASSNSIDESILRNTWKMEGSIKKILDGERGVDFAKQLLSEAL